MEEEKTEEASENLHVQADRLWLSVLSSSVSVCVCVRLHGRLNTLLIAPAISEYWPDHN